MASHDPEVVAFCVRAYMSHIRRADDQVREIERQIRDVRARLEGLGCPMGKDGGGRSSLSDKMAEGVARVMELEAAWCERVAETLADRLEGLGCPMGKDGGGRSSLSDKMAEGVARVMELEAAWCERVAETLADADECRRICDPAHVWRWALYMHLVEGRTWAYAARVVGYSEQHGAYAARVVGYSEQHVKRNVPQAMREVYYLMPERFRREPIPNAMPR